MEQHREGAAAVGEKIKDFRARILVEQLDGVAQIAGGGVMSVVKPGRENEDLFHIRSINVF